MKKNEWQPLFDRLDPFIEDAAQTHYDGDRERGFKFWAVKQALMDMGLSDDALKDPLLLDGSSDLGIDGYYEDAEGEALILVQSRFHEKPLAVGNDELNRFFQSLTKLLNPEIVVAAAAKNPLAQDAHRAVRDATARGWTLRFMFVSSGYLSPEGRTYASTASPQTETMDSIPIRKELEVYDIQGLERLYESHLLPTRLNTDFELDLTGTEYFEANIDNFPVMVAAVPARDIVRAFKTHGYSLFRLNPRGPLQNRVNSKIKQTLQDPNSRKLFFHLNNGLTALCENFRVQPDGKLQIRDFQIVNGCQTTVTLARVGAIVEADAEIRILMRLMEGMHGIRREIAEATNTQARLTAQDFKSNDALQQDLKNQFDALPAPIFYEVKRGDWEMTDSDRKSRFQEKGTRSFRRISMVDLAQATLAFLGEPGDAKDKPRTIFEDESRYKKVFPDKVRAQQLLLPWLVYESCDRLCRGWPQFSGATYARYCLAALVGSELAPGRNLLPVQDASRALASPERIQPLIVRGQNAVTAVIAVLGDDYPGHREFFRSADSFEKVLKTYRTQPG